MVGKSAWWYVVRYDGDVCLRRERRKGGERGEKKERGWRVPCGGKEETRYIPKKLHRMLGGNDDNDS